MNPENIAVIEDETDLAWIAAVIDGAARHGQRVRLCVEGGGLKVAAGGGMWTLPIGKTEA